MVKLTSNGTSRESHKPSTALAGLLTKRREVSIWGSIEVSFDEQSRRFCGMAAGDFGAISILTNLPPRLEEDRHPPKHL